MAALKSTQTSEKAGSILPFQVRRTPRGSAKTAFSTIRDLAREFDVTLRALRFYEAKGLLHPIRQGATRVYTAKDRVRLELILTGKTLGFTLTEIAAMLDEAGDEDAGLRLSPELLLQQIQFLEEQHKTTLAALAELRRHYYILTEVEPHADMSLE
jgi:DNA-binding transcriptional MerR regulator